MGMTLSALKERGCRELNPGKGDRASPLVLKNTSATQRASRYNGALGLLLLGLLGEQDRVDVREHTAGRNKLLAGDGDAS